MLWTNIEQDIPNRNAEDFLAPLESAIFHKQSW